MCPEHVWIPSRQCAACPVGHRGWSLGSTVHQDARGGRGRTWRMPRDPRPFRPVPGVGVRQGSQRSQGLLTRELPVFLEKALQTLPLSRVFSPFRNPWSQPRASSSSSLAKRGPRLCASARAAPPPATRAVPLTSPADASLCRRHRVTVCQKPPQLSGGARPAPVCPPGTLGRWQLSPHVGA